MNFCPISKSPCPHARVVHVTEINNGKITELHLCQKCGDNFTGENSVKPKKSVPTIPPGFLALMQAILLQPLMAESPKTFYPPCPKCGTTTADIVQTGRLGCAECYSHFQSGVGSILARCQVGATQHVGKVPKKWTEEQAKLREQKEAALDKNERIKNLKLKMAKAIEIENYEVAGVLKKKIEELQQ